MDLRQIEYVAALYRERHFQRAAERVHISQPTLSQRVKALEKELGAPLFERSSRWVRPTPAGELFIPQALAALESLESSVEEARRGAGQPLGRLSVAAIPTLAPYILPGALKILRARAPRLRLEVHELTTSLLLERLKDGRVDVGILALPIEERGLVARGVGREPFFLAVPAGHPLASRKAVRPDDLKMEHLLILQEGHCFRSQSLEVCHRSADDPRIVFEGGSLGSVLKMAEAGEGVTLVPRMAVDRGAYPGLVFRPFAPPVPTREVGFAWRVTTPLGRSHEMFMDLAEKEIKRRIGS